MNQFHEIFFLIFSVKIKFYLMENIKKKIHEIDSFHEFFCLDFFKNSGPLWNFCSKVKCKNSLKLQKFFSNTWNNILIIIFLILYVQGLEWSFYANIHFLRPKTVPTVHTLNSWRIGKRWRPIQQTWTPSEDAILPKLMPPKLQTI